MPTQTQKKRKLDRKKLAIYKEWLLKMQHIRLFEENIYDLLGQNVIKGGSHLYAGEEAVAVGACSAIKPDDLITSTHRGHGHAIAKGGSLRSLMAEIFGKSTGSCKGKGGSLHLADLNTGNLGANGIVAGSVPIATGAGLSIKLRKSNQVCLCFFGDGATNLGVFHESLNMASKWELPVVYICENNLYGMSVSVERASAINPLHKKAAAHNIPADTVDGMDVVAVNRIIEREAALARNGHGPRFIECLTYRYFGHSRSDPRKYRSREEEKAWKKKDPIIKLSNSLLDEKLCDQQELDKISAQAESDINDAVQFAKDSPWPEPDELYRDVYTGIFDEVNAR